jgi:putative transposase
MRPGKVETREFEYIRHGTQSLIASFDIATGRVVEPSCGDSRTESDFVQHIRRVIESDPMAIKWHLVIKQPSIIQAIACFHWWPKTKTLSFRRSRN